MINMTDQKVSSREQLQIAEEAIKRAQANKYASVQQHHKLALFLKHFPALINHKHLSKELMLIQNKHYRLAAVVAMEAAVEKMKKVKEAQAASATQKLEAQKIALF